MADRQYGLKFGGNAGASVDAYLEYRRIVGDDDGGNMFTPEEYEAYKKKVIPQRVKNRLYTCYTNPAGMDCKLIGPETPCFCTHRYKQHKTDFASIPSSRPILLPCKVSGCPCASYHYVPLNGSQSIRCTCKHLADDHNVKAPFICKKAGCTKCTGFKSSFTCACGSGHNDHRMIVETADEREARGHPLGEAVPFQAMGGITGFSSLAEGYLRLDPSGRGAPSDEFLNQPITAQDNPFLRANVNSIKAHHMAKHGGHAITGGNERVFDDIEERISAVKKEGESDMDFFERRYQERQKLEAQARRNPIPNPYTQTSSKVGTRKAIEPSRAKSGKSTKSQPGSSRQ
ncbi:protein FAM221A [Aplysia californica]|uniref:Protein FAM221A n=1 Tax=Aplysia californica TaxID=6500 RepID=A0ABM0JKC9_APLCA|nr:protein FAM221A [Aplysia californica]